MPVYKMRRICQCLNDLQVRTYIVVAVLLFDVHGNQLRSFRDGQLPNHTFPGQA